MTLDRATAEIDAQAPPEERFRAMWLAIHRHMAANREHALFLLQVDASPYRAEAHAAAHDVVGDPLIAQTALRDVAARLLPLPLEVVYELGIAPAVRIAVGDTHLSEDELAAVADACWRAISR